MTVSQSAPIPVVISTSTTTTVTVTAPVPPLPVPDSPSTPNIAPSLNSEDPMTKYSKMKKLGIPMHCIKNKMTMDGVDREQIAQFSGESVLNEIDFSKYDKMKKIKCNHVSSDLLP